MGINTNKETADELEKGYSARSDLIKSNFLTDTYKEIEQIDEQQKKNVLDLYSLIEKGKIEVRIYAKKFFHSKAYLFDHDDIDFPCTSIVGSSNFTNRGLTGNIELNSVLRSKSAYDYLVNWFDEFWEEAESFDRALLDTRSILFNKPLNDITSSKAQSEEKDSPEESLGVKDPFADIVWKVPQSIGYQNWLNNKKKGILQIATGVGKTLIGIRAVNDFIIEHQDSERKAIVLIGVHSNPMIEQWREELIYWLDESNFEQIQSISGEKKKSIDLQIEDLKLNLELFKNTVVIAHYNTICSKLVPFLNKLELKNDILFISDEVHELGTKNRIKKIKDFHPISCLGLSATPQRYFDKSGTDFLKDFFNGIVYTYTIEQAIEDNYLCGYKYKPIICKLSGEELEKYRKMTRLLAMEQEKTPKDKEKIKRIAMKRSKIVKKAKSKEDKIIELINQIQYELKEKNKTLKHMLVYFEDNSQLLDTYGKLPLNVVSERITEEYPVDKKDRRKLIRELKIGATQMIFAIQILDQGINIPELKYAIIVASTGNEKQYIQRRGRILRPLDGKQYAEIYDLVIPQIESEQKRVKVFYNSCSNKDEVKAFFRELDIDIDSIRMKFERTLEEEEV